MHFNVQSYHILTKWPQMHPCMWIHWKFSTSKVLYKFKNPKNARMRALNHWKKNASRSTWKLFKTHRCLTQSFISHQAFCATLSMCLCVCMKKLRVKLLLWASNLKLFHLLYSLSLFWCQFLLSVFIYYLLSHKLFAYD